MDRGTFEAVQALINQMGNDTQDQLTQLSINRFPWYYPKGAIGLMVEEFTYQLDWDPLLPSVPTSKIFQVDADSAFIMTQRQLVETDTEYTTFLAQWPLLVELKSSASGAFLSNGPVPANNWFGTAQRPYILPVPRIIAPASSFSTTMTNLEAVNRVVRATYAGFKVYNFPGSAGGRDA